MRHCPAALVIGLCGCTGAIMERGDLAGDNGGTPAAPGAMATKSGSSGSGPSPAAGPAAPTAACGLFGTAPNRSRAPLRRLSSAQYNNTVRDLLGDTTRPADRFLSSEVAGVFTGSATLAEVSPVVIEQYRDAAERLAAAAVKNLGTLLPCKPDAAGEEACARAFLEDFGLKAYRRPLTVQELAEHIDVYRRARMDADFATGIQTALELILQSPLFLYRAELVPAGAAAGAVVPLGPYDIATRASYFIWNTTPDRELLTAAKEGRLATPADIERQARRLLGDPRAREGLGQFFRDWLLLGAIDTLEKDRKLFPEFTDELKRAMKEETQRFATGVLFDGDARLESLLTSSQSFVNASLAKLYGVPSSGADFSQTTLNPAERSGILTQASLMALTAHEADTSATKRGKFVRDQILCQPPPPPPPDIQANLPRPKPGQTWRSFFQETVSKAPCGTCHSTMDPIGFGFEAYNPVGRFQPTVAGKPVDSSGELLGTCDADGSFSGAVELSRRLARSGQAKACMVRQWFEFAHGRSDEVGDQASLKAISDAFTATSNLRDLVVAVTKTEAFRTRIVEAP